MSQRQWIIQPLLWSFISGITGAASGVLSVIFVIFRAPGSNFFLHLSFLLGIVGFLMCGLFWKRFAKMGFRIPAK